MESIYEPERFYASELVNLREYFTEFSHLTLNDRVDSLVNERNRRDTKNTNIMGIDIDLTTLRSLEETCSIDKLLCDGELKAKPKHPPTMNTLRGMVFESLPFTRKFSDLEVLKTKARIEKYRSCEKFLFMNKENFHNSIIDKESEKKLPTDLCPGSDFVMSVIFYRPFRFDFCNRNNAGKCRFSQEIEILGSNTLTALRDRIICPSDSGLQLEVDGPTADVSHLLNAKEEYPSACFFVDGVIYNDIRSPKAIEYSEEIMKWATAKNVGEFSKADMHTTKIMDLSLRFGYPYVYIHQGDCEHIMVFSDAHILTNNDCLNSQQYPRLFAMNRSHCTICYMCNTNASKWLVRDYNRLPQSYTFLCAKCAEWYCSIDGEKVGDYKIYPLFNLF